MSEEILNALIQLFAIIAKQDEGLHPKELEYVESFLTQQLGKESVEEYLIQFKKKATAEDEKKTRRTNKKLTLVSDSVRILGLCKKINKTLNRRQKVVVLVRLFEMVNASRQFTPQRMAIINTVAEVFNIARDEYEEIHNFVVSDKIDQLDFDSILIVDDKDVQCSKCKFIKTESIDGYMVILRVRSADLYFLRYTGQDNVLLNGLPVFNNRIYLFATGATVKLPRGKPVYYSDVVAKFLADYSTIRLSFDVIDVHYRFPTGDVGLHRINFSESQGKLVGIMGASGSGKTTLLNILTGIYTPTSGKVLINGIDLHKEKDKIEGVLGYIPQDDLLIEELTVFENLYYNAQLCFRGKTKEEITELVNKTLKSLGLYEIRHLKVGNIFNKLISGGQRKRLNVALELIREPSILFVDEPTTGLSSRDSENVMDLLRELALKGKLVVVVIHQPSSDIYKMFDNMLILDSGYEVYYGNPIEAIMYFKRLDNQVNADVGECPVCGTVRPETIFNILEAKKVDEFGHYIDERKVSPPKWEEYFYSLKKIHRVPTVHEAPKKALNLPSKFKQYMVFLTRDLKAKLSNSQYVILTLTETPILGGILAFLIRYIADPMSNVYIFYDNVNMPAYIFMSIVVALFFGLIVSAEEIFRDRKILKREKFLNLSRHSYLLAKISILIVISAIQAFEYVIIGNTILGIKDMTFIYWFALFSTFVFANMLGLNISSAFNSAVTIYIMIPLIMIPLMALGGAFFSFDKLNRKISTIGKVPPIAEFMESRWAYEALMVYEFKNNRFEKIFFDIDKAISQADYKQVHWIPAVKDHLSEAYDALVTMEEEPDANIDSLKFVIEDNLKLVYNEIKEELRKNKNIAFDYLDKLNLQGFTEDVYEATDDYLDKLNDYYGQIFFNKDSEKEAIKTWMAKKDPHLFIKLRNKYHNEHIADIVTNKFEKYKILEYKHRLIQQVDPIFQDPDDSHWFGFRSHFFAPQKYFMGHYYETYWFNMAVIWFMSLLLYPPLYFEHMRKLIEWFGRIKMPKFPKLKKIRAKDETESKK